MKKKKVLILGGSGFIGFGIVKYLVENRNYDITIADIFYSNQEDIMFNKYISDNKIRMIKGDFTKIKMFDKLENTYDFVYMLASVVGVNRCIEEPHEVIRINVSLIQNTLEWIIKNKIRRVLFSSSSECYAATTDEFDYLIPTPEQVPLTIANIAHPRFTYAVTKILGESAFLTYGKKYNFFTTIVRYQNIFGPRMGFKHVIPHLVERFIKGENPYKIYGGDQTRSFCYITDAAKGTVLAIENKNSDQNIFHIGSPDEITIEKLVKSVGNLMGFNGEYLPAKTYPGSVARRCPDISKAKRILKYVPNVDWKVGLDKTVSWYVEYFNSGNIIKDGGFKPPEKLTIN